MTIENGTKVLIFHRYEREKEYMSEFIQGEVIKSELSDDLSHHGSPWNVTNYTVLGEDGKEYFGNYRHPTLGDYFFLTIKDYIIYLKGIDEGCDTKIRELKNVKKSINKLLDNIQK